MEYKEIKLEQVKIIDNIRQSPIKEDLTELMQSIKKNGLMQPIGVKKVHNKEQYILIWGYRRFKAFEKLGRATIPARLFISEDEILSEDEFLILNATENLQRKTISVMELGRICKILKQNMSFSEMAVKLSIPLTRIKTSVQELDRVPEKFKNEIVYSGAGNSRNGKIPMNVAVSIGRLNGLNDKQREDIFQWVKITDKTSAEIEALGNLIKMKMPIDKAKEELNNWRCINVKCLVNKDRFSSIMKKFDSQTEFLKKIVNEKYKGLVF